MRSLGDVMNSSVMHMPRAKSEFNLTSATVESKRTVPINSNQVYVFSGNLLFICHLQPQNMTNVQWFVLYTRIWHRVKIN